jgi:hypothetical protein
MEQIVCDREFYSILLGKTTSTRKIESSEECTDIKILKKRKHEAKAEIGKLYPNKETQKQYDDRTRYNTKKREEIKQERKWKREEKNEELIKIYGKLETQYERSERHKKVRDAKDLEYYENMNQKRTKGERLTNKEHLLCTNIYERLIKKDNSYYIAMHGTD